MRTKLALPLALLSVLTLTGCYSKSIPENRIDEWERGFLVASPENPGMKVFIWFYEWHLFDALLPGIHTRGPKEWSGFRKHLSEDGSDGWMVSGTCKISVPETQEKLLQK